MIAKPTMSLLESHKNLKLRNFEPNHKRRFRFVYRLVYCYIEFDQ